MKISVDWLGAKAMFRTHGDCPRGNRSTEYRTWNAMLQRCENGKSPNYSNYGGRGISVCERWHSFELFLSDVGRKPTPEHSIDRYPNNDGNYEPGNVRWATPKEQSRNQRSSRIVTAFGKSATMAEWSELSGIEVTVIRERLNRGWVPDEAVSKKPEPEFLLTADGRSMTIPQWSAETGIKYGTLHARVHRYKWPAEKCLGLAY